MLKNVTGPRTAIYARYSSDLQRPTSIDDQVALCKRRAAEIGASKIETYSDAAASGSSTHNRPGYSRLLEAVRARQFDVVIVEGIDRLSRDQEDTAHAYKIFEFADCRIDSLNEGQIGDIHIAMKGAMNALYLKDLGHRVRRGQGGALERGRVPAGLAYGYRTAPSLRADGTVDRGHRVVNPGEADIIRRIFHEYAAGKSARTIAAALNSDGIPSPRGKAWNASTINGSRARATGILQNQIYVGHVFLNRQTFRKHPSTGRRIPKVNGREAWLHKENPTLAIVEPDLWKAVQLRRLKYADYPMHKQRRPKRALSGLVFCGDCGSPYTVNGLGRLRCVSRAERGTCDNGRIVLVEELEQIAVSGLKKELLSADVINVFVSEYRAERLRLLAAGSAESDSLAAEREAIGKKVANLVDAIENRSNATPKSIIEQIERYEQRIEEINAVLSNSHNTKHKNVKELNADLPKRYRQFIGQLEKILDRNPDVRNVGNEALRSIVARVDILPQQGRGNYRIRLQGRSRRSLGLRK